jgi:hypothetical protein
LRSRDAAEPLPFFIPRVSPRWPTSPRPEIAIVHLTSSRAGCCALLLLLFALGPPRTARADVSDHIAAEGGLGVGAALITLVYSPVKLVYATGGIVIAGTTFLWTMGDSQVASAMFRSSLAGDYVITPSHLTGREKLRFKGSVEMPASS